MEFVARISKISEIFALKSAWLKAIFRFFKEKSDIASSQYYKKHKSPVTLQKMHQHYKYVAFFESA